LLTCENGSIGVSRNGLDKRRETEGASIRTEGLGRIKGEEVGKETGYVERSHGGPGDVIGRRIGSNPSGEGVRTWRQELEA
jgi:hypothetical protein